MKRRARHRPPAWVLAVLVLLLIASRYFAPPREPREPADRPPEAPSVVRRVRRVVDGDTFLLDDGTRVRLQGVDAPESVKPDHPVEPFGREASRFAKRFLAPGVVRLEFDGELYDRHGRLLAYVWCGDRMLNEELLREGLARSEPWFRFSAEKKTRFARAQDEARQARRGIWSVRP